MTNDPSIREQSYRYFLQEAPELLQVLEQDLLTLREDYSINKVHNLMRTTHTLKGAAASVGLETIKTVAHSLEDIFKALFNPDLSIDPDIEALLFEGYECLRLPLNAELTGGNINHAEILDRTAAIFAQLQEKLGDCFGAESHIPSSVELGFDVTQSIFEVGVNQRLEEIAAVIASAEPAAIATLLRTQSEVFQGLAESLNLPGFGAIAQAATRALDEHPDQVILIAQTALADFQTGQEAVLNGDRTQGGQPSALLQQLSGLQPSTQTEIEALEAPGEELTLTSDWTESVSDLVDYPGVEVEVYSETSLASNLEPPDFSEFESFSLFDTVPEVPLEVEESDTFQTPTWTSQPEVHSHSSAYDSELNLDESPEEESANLLLESIWGETGETDTEREQEIHPEADEVTASSPHRLPSPSTSATPPHSISRTVRVNVEHLEHLNYAIGELLTNQNRQTLENEQLKASVRTLLARLQQHQQQLNELQDWSDRQFVDVEQRQMGKRVQRERWTVAGGAVGVANATPGRPAWTSERPAPLALSNSDDRFDSLELDRYSEAQLLVQSILEDAVQLGEATEAIDLFTKQSQQTLEKQRRLLSGTRDALMEARMLPLAEIFGRFPRVLRQLEVSHNKRVELELQGTEVLVDKLVAQKLYDPLLHLVRNAFDHGIESSNLRQKRGKPQKGQIAISASHRGRHLVIEVRDDGQGLDFDKIRQRAVELLFSPERVSALNEAQLTDLLFEPGFSTAAQVNDLSGRGVGLDVVRAQLDSLQGSVGVESEAGKGTTFTLQIPLNLTIAKLLICQSGEHIYSLFTDAIVSILIPQANQLRAWEGGKVLRWNQGVDGFSQAAVSELQGASGNAPTSERLIPIHSLAKVLDYFSSPSPLAFQPKPSFVSQEQTRPVILLRCVKQGYPVGEDTLMALEVDQLIGEQELVIRPLGGMMVPPSYVYGGSVLADGRLTLVLDAAALSQYVLDQQIGSSTEEHFATSTAHLLSGSPQQRLLPPQNRAALPAPPAEVRAKQNNMVLLVDDSITLRQTLTLTLQKAGYQVLQAKDGYEALEQLRVHTGVELVICDIEMPRMNGFEFLKHRQQDSALGTIPVIILTSRSGEKHRLIATELGATSYITKPFLEHQLLGTVNNVMETKS
jgi:chemotaxis protein histidine kinase CheA/CheY-like chemotaxis protein